MPCFGKYDNADSYELLENKTGIQLNTMQQIQTTQDIRDLSQQTDISSASLQNLVCHKSQILQEKQKTV